MASPTADGFSTSLHSSDAGCLYLSNRGRAENWLDSVPRFSKFTDQLEEPKEFDVEEFKQALKKNSPRKSLANMSDGNVQEDIQSLKQGEGETLMVYHERAQDLLRRSNGRDDASDNGLELSALEKTMLSIIVKAFIRGVRDNNLRSMIMMKSTILHGSLQGAYDKSKKAMECISQRNDIEKERLERMELDHFREQYQQQWGRPLSVALAGVGQRKIHNDIGPPTRMPERMSTWQNPAATAASNQEIANANLGVSQGQMAGPQTSSASRPTRPLMVPNNRNDRFDQKDTPPKHLSQHPIIKGSKAISKDGGVLCIRCGELGQRKPECTGKPLEWWEQNLS
ncbi:hypothetical protein GcC1_003032 [Golovinomyces cichoracearum]|uniref:Retrotransposon gag domain-containing protein n=1 Tax=Golovinomyces cichoracearum TaxID=62708 RepID=A0A420J995_9PEZI|nr:hypothetical protein GcC1_003032 [Golovinomyces cichoracearum]